MGALTCTQPSTEGPTKIPARTIRTAPGTGSRGTRLSSTGTATATKAMTSTPAKDKAGISKAP
jgi:hypothetical protein